MTKSLRSRFFATCCGAQSPAGVPAGASMRSGSGMPSRVHTGTPTFGKRLRGLQLSPFTTPPTGTQPATDKRRGRFKIGQGATDAFRSVDPFHRVRSGSILRLRARSQTRGVLLCSTPIPRQIRIGMSGTNSLTTFGLLLVWPVSAQVGLGRPGLLCSQACCTTSESIPPHSSAAWVGRSKEWTTQRPAPAKCCNLRLHPKTKSSRSSLHMR